MFYLVSSTGQLELQIPPQASQRNRGPLNTSGPCKGSLGVQYACKCRNCPTLPLPILTPPPALLPSCQGTMMVLGAGDLGICCVDGLGLVAYVTYFIVKSVSRYNKGFPEAPAMPSVAHIAGPLHRPRLGVGVYTEPHSPASTSEC